MSNFDSPVKYFTVNVILFILPLSRPKVEDSVFPDKDLFGRRDDGRVNCYG